MCPCANAKGEDGELIPSRAPSQPPTLKKRSEFSPVSSQFPPRAGGKTITACLRLQSTTSGVPVGWLRTALVAATARKRGQYGISETCATSLRPVMRRRCAFPIVDAEPFGVRLVRFRSRLGLNQMPGRGRQPLGTPPLLCLVQHKTMVLVYPDADVEGAQRAYTFPLRTASSA